MNISGAKWWKFDFHTHSPASIDYGKEKTELKSLTAREWLLEFMKKKIDCVAVTDHNTGSWIDQLKNEAEKMKTEGVEGYRNIYIFPGIEITVNGGIHLLAIFDLSKTSEDIAGVMGSVKYTGTKGESNGCTELAFGEVVREIVKSGGIAIPAHVDIDSGLLKEQNGVTLTNSLSEKGILALEVCDLSYEKPQIYKDLKLRLCEVSGSDCHKPEHVGRCYTWVKMEQPNINALWLALHDGQDGILRYDEFSDDPNDIKKRFFIKKLIIKDGAKIGRGTAFSLDFSPWMSTLIGGRGSGKSSILNYMRIVFNNKGRLKDRLKTDFEDFAKISLGREKLGMLLENTQIRIEMWKDGRDIALVWEKGNTSEEHYDLAKGKWVEKGESVSVIERFPVRMFSQKELYDITNNPSILLDLIDQQFDKPKINELHNKLNEKWVQSKIEERKIQQSITSKKGLLVDIDDVKAKMKVFEESDHKTILEDYKNSQDTDKLIKDIHKTFIDNNSVIKEILEKATVMEIPNNLIEKLDESSNMKLLSIVEKYNKCREEMGKQNESLNELALEWVTVISELPWNENKKDLQAKYNDLIEKLEEKGEKNPNAYQDLVLKKQELESKIKDIEKNELRYTEQKSGSKEIYDSIVENQKELRNYREAIIGKWNSENKNIKLQLEIMADIKKSEMEFRTTIRKTGEEYKKDILELDEEENPIGGLIFKMSNSVSADVWRQRELSIESIITATESNTNGYGKYFIKHLEGLRTSTPDDFDKLSVWFPEDKVLLKLIESGKTYDIETGSAGQRTAAVLSLILSLEDSPLVVDQPEDDLDTKRITDLVVSGFRNLKSSQQIIVVTHNPNIPVNGGAEQIIHLGFIKGLIRAQTVGALQKRDVRQAVCDVMEGGKEALDNRYHRISKALEE